ncbi:LexA-binding, inner membrane-associated putative hydrolase [Asanoa ishikariensis]|uniref:LexA-binding, inner membrane-associated putative hydrolase n=1 Tax=Asanoa ishikariensis TaxID=137265 RepID=A0A1H3RUJ8_9ACTN|nr:metal-dependent hydrolase [Asanoa ishikariensis]SDZ29292.1 LexA-binding, inner membrane-associated putative hydrolase [Asanoa ishikariensis]
MMGKSHALSGAVGWLGGCAGLVAAGHPVAPLSIVAGAAVASGFALLPDIDHPSSTVSRTLGPITRLISQGVSAGAAAFGKATCDHCERRPGQGGHRLVTHTVPFAILVFLLTALAGRYGGVTASIVIVGFAVWLATHSALRSHTRAEIVDALIPGQVRGKRARKFTAALGSIIAATAIAFAVHHFAEPGASWWWVGIAAGWGTLAHTLGDSITHWGSPLFWPARIRGCTWRTVGTPKWMRFRAGGPVERWLMVPGMALIGLGAAYLLLAPVARGYFG